MPADFSQGVNLPLAFGSKDAKFLAIRILSREFPLPAKQVYQKIVREEPLAKLTYQAVHKALRHLLELNVLSKDSSGRYSLSSEWIGQYKDFGQKIESFYSHANRPSYLDLKDGESMVVEFNGLIIEPLYYWISEMFKVAAVAPPKTVCYAHHRWAWAATTVISDKEYGMMKELFRKCPIYILCRSDKIIDRAILGMWEEHFGAKTKSGVACALASQLFCIGDFIVDIYLDPKASEQWDAIWAGVKTADDVPRAIFQKTRLHFSHTGRTKVIVTRDAYASSILRNETLKYFR